MIPAAKSKWIGSAAFVAAASLAGTALVAQSLGSVKTEGAEIAGRVTVSGGRAVIANSGSVTANAGTAEI